MPYRVPAPPPVDEPEAEEPYVAVLRRQRRRTLLGAGFGAVAFAVLLAGVSHARPEEDGARDLVAEEHARRTHATRSIAEAERRLGEQQDTFERRVRAAIAAGVAPRESLGRCPVRLSGDDGLSRGRAFPLLVVAPSEVEAGRLPSQAIAEALADVRRAEAHVAAGRYDEAALYAEALEHPGRLTFDVVLVAGSKKDPHVTSDSAFVPGWIAGRAYVYDFASETVVCAGDVEAKSSEAIGFAYSVGNDAPAASSRASRLAESIDADLRAQTERAIAKSIVYRAAPP